MNIDVYWKRICGLQVQADGQLAAVWIAVDPRSDRITLYDCLQQKREVLAVQAQAIRARGKWIPVAWPEGAEEITGRLLNDYGVNILPESVTDSDQVAETVSLDIWERMRTGRFKVAPELSAWLQEYETFQRRDLKIPRESHPLMTATRLATAMLPYARAEAALETKRPAKPKLRIR